MKIAVLSGKGGTGKTFVAVNLAAASAEPHSVYIDCDVEEPNGHLFFKPAKINTKPVHIKVPVVDEKLCNACRKCVDFCKYNALALVNDKPFVFDEICHSCGGCSLICPQNAISERDKKIGEIQTGISDNVNVITGMLEPGQESGVPIIKTMLSSQEANLGLTVIDCPPGSACTVMESIRDADYCILVAEPTLFGVHNLNIVYDLVKFFKKPHGVVMNKCLDTDNPVEVFCHRNDMKILAKIQFNKKLALMNSKALIAAREDNLYHDLFVSLLYKVKEEVQNEAITNS
ncbi:4Fe-4S binding protein [Bacillus marasmi]|uniref:nucleotide-binding protein n=1 Tax=Bacillus marasmi TaxID=1926279 RepID=UPI0011C9DE7F|nr:ATP-binding protein [Bacillus marasmi]